MLVGFGILVEVGFGGVEWDVLRPALVGVGQEGTAQAFEVLAVVDKGWRRFAFDINSGLYLDGQYSCLGLDKEVDFLS